MMTRELLRNIFSRFENLNLLTLIHDLRNGEILREGWYDTNPFGQVRFCPIAHGWVCGYMEAKERGFVETVVNRTIKEDAFVERTNEYAMAGIPANLGDPFVTWWDGDGNDHTKGDAFLLKVLEELYSERLADAEAYQELVATPNEVPVLVGEETW